MKLQAAAPDQAMPLLIGDHTALDLINTVAQVDGAPVDFWQDDRDVLDWLQRTGWLAAPVVVQKPGALLKAARELREAVRVVVAQRKDGGAVDVTALNAILARGSGFYQLTPDGDGNLKLDRHYAANTPEQLLAPLAESAAALLEGGDFALVRKCESDDCTLWFYDRTKSHRRRWCSMALCGNRHKVTSFRQRQRDAGA